MTSRPIRKTPATRSADRFPEFPPRDDMQNSIYLDAPAHQAALSHHFGRPDTVNGGGMLGHWGGVKLYHLVCSCPPKKSELSGQHKCPCQLLREMPCRRVGQQMAGRKVLMQPILREARLKVGRQRSPCYA